ncbi:MAG: MBL fold metallo-hydrolase [Desulfarculaceae bacterium]|nr:MBL fold metallo-hydrolase [Desulfarculaceae bacterium]MCF8072708.1 MBL fold metallo-hydrolase [Desulfarculaceae bacterium]MCF8102587.1 MBL fold metallo-hydrolase [Desulfarculaceae bacterium]MCF8116496.1 MBL fold metallo-hydrolase [Desulfarculaceae bacterium]
MKFRFWGTRGSLPAPGPDTLVYGGNSTCCSIEHEGRHLVIDAGSGIRLLGAELMGPGPMGGSEDASLEVTLLMTHLHFDHIMGFPFFAPAYTPGAVIRLGGWPKCLKGIKGMFKNGRYDGGFPVSFAELPSKILRDEALTPPRFAWQGMEVRTTPLNHPQGAVGYRFEAPGGALVFITDNELAVGAPPPKALVEFCSGAAVLIHDAQYLPSEMDICAGRGHSEFRACLALAQAAGAGRLILTHHDPGRTDAQIEAMIDQARAEAGSLPVEGAREGQTLEL